MMEVGNSRILRIILLLIVVCFVSLPAYAKYSGGMGEPNDPYRIATAEDLMLLGESPEDYGKHFILTADIDLDPNLPGRKVFDKAVIASDGPGGRGTQSKRFTGVFDGNGHSISHLTIAGGSGLGLFGQLGYGAKISNLGLEAVRVNGTGNFVGGLVGWNELGNIRMSHSTGMVTGNKDIGGLVGFNKGSITASYSTGAVSGDRDVGGLVGWNGGSTAASYSTSTVTGTENTGGLVGSNKGSITASFWDIQTSGQTSSAGGIGLTTAEMKDIDTYLNAGWDFVDETLNGTCDYWQISPGDYPKLHYHFGESLVMLEGSGTAGEPYLIRDARDLGTVWFKPLAHYRLEAPVDLSGITWSVAVIPWFGGTFDGNGYVISNLHIQGGGYLGLFGKLDSGAIVSNLGLEAIEVDGIGDYIGGLVGWNEGSIAQSYSTGMVNGDYSVGGLVGENRHGGSITKSYSTGSVTGSITVGGLAGDNFDSITSSYSTSTVTGGLRVGGLAGENTGSIITSYSTSMVTGRGDGVSDIGGLVGRNTGGITASYSSGRISANRNVGGLVGWSQENSITSSFWDIQTSGQETSAGGMGKTTAEMQTAATFLEAGWDFVDETENGTEDIWWILEGQDYPRLWWELTESRFIVVDDFESYNDLDISDPMSNRIFFTWIDGYGDPNNGSFVDCAFPCPEIFHGGMQSMPFSYDNSGLANYSEATANIAKLAIDHNWTIEGVGVLSLWFYGGPANAPEPMYVGIANANGPTAAVFHDNPDAPLINEWTQWNIDLQEFADQGVDLTNVGSISIGFGDKKNPQPGGSGKVWFDDIRLYRLAP